MKPTPTLTAAPGYDTEQLRGLHVLKPGEYLQLPEHFQGTNRVWARPGDVIDFDDEYYRVLAAGHARKLEPAPKGVKATEVSDPRVTSHRKHWIEARERSLRLTAEEDAARQAARESGASAGIEAPQGPKRKGKANQPEEAAPAA